MKILILGGAGMLGHKMWQTLAPGFDTYVTVRDAFAQYRKYGLFDPLRTIPEVSAEDFDTILRAVDKLCPDVIVNCIGIVKQSPLGNNPVKCITINALFPNLLAELSSARGIRLIHISTDCVFSGRKGNYIEDDISDAEDLYGRTKFLGEVSGKGCLTVRTSIIGREIESSNGLIEWFLGQEGKTVNGYARSIFSGLTTTALSNIIGKIIGEHPNLQGVYHVASPPINKHDLLLLVKRVFKLEITIKRDETIVIDRSLNADRFNKATGLIQSEWHDMIETMYRDLTPYSELRRLNVNR